MSKIRLLKSEDFPKSGIMGKIHSCVNTLVNDALAREGTRIPWHELDQRLVEEVFDTYIPLDKSFDHIAASLIVGIAHNMMLESPKVREAQHGNDYPVRYYYRVESYA